uniref:Nucleoside diphosphate kinase n=1 Tax=Canis lupus familiaris TaxID=9615 RepID=A0A8C0N6L2_CANLF
MLAVPRRPVTGPPHGGTGSPAARRGTRRCVPSALGQVWFLSGSPGPCQGRVPGGAGAWAHRARARARARQGVRAELGPAAGAPAAGPTPGPGDEATSGPRAPGAGTAARAASASRVGRRGVRGVAVAQPSSRAGPGPAARSPSSLPARRAASFPAMAHQERTFIAIKPDGVQRGLVGDIVKRFEQKGFRLVAMKFLRASEDLLKEHYIDLKDRPFYPGLVKYMHSGPVVAMVWEGLNVVKTGRMMLGETNPADSKPGTIRGDFCIQVGRNIIHGSDSVKSAEKEISLWFKPEELVDYKSCAFDWIYE